MEFLSLVAQSAEYVSAFDLNSIEINRPERANKGPLHSVALLRKNIAETVGEMKQAHQAQDWEKMRAAERKLARYIDSQAENAREMAARLYNPAQKAALLHIADKLTELNHQIAAINEALMRDPNNKELIAERDRLPFFSFANTKPTFSLCFTTDYLNKLNSSQCKLNWQPRTWPSRANRLTC